VFCGLAVEYRVAEPMAAVKNFDLFVFPGSRALNPGRDPPLRSLARHTFFCKALHGLDGFSYVLQVKKHKPSIYEIKAIPFSTNLLFCSKCHKA
jgi:hypothetical protein